MTMQYPRLTDREGYELFRSAIAERSSEAWSAIYQQYRPLLLGWSRQCCARSASYEFAEDIADQAFMRAWSALTAEQFSEFDGIAPLLAYLRSCVSAAVIDASRARITRDRAYGRLEAIRAATPEQQALAHELRVEFWELIASIVASEPERVVLHATFVLALPPRQIQARHPTMFDTVDAIYAIKRNLLGRLERSRELRQLFEDLRS